MRLFVAIDLPELQRLQVERLYPLPLAGAKAVPLTQLHLTLAFLGEIHETRISEIKKNLATVGFTPFQLGIAAMGAFPNAKRPRVLWLGTEAKPELLVLQQEIEKVLRNFGWKPEARAFTPHFTLARFKFSRADEVENFLTRHAGFKSEPWEVREFLLYSSDLTPQGAIHTVRQNYPAWTSAK